MFALGIMYFLFLLLTLIFLLYIYTSRNYNHWKKRNVRYIKPAPFVGNLLPILQMKLTTGAWLGQLYENIKTDVLGIFVFDQPVLVIQSPKLVKSVLVKDFHYFEDRAAVTNMDDPVMSNILFFKRSPTWKPVRAKLSPIFTSQKLKLMFPLILKESKDMTEYIRKFVNVPNVEAKEICGKYSVNVIARCAFAVEARSFQNEDAEFRAIAREMFDYRLGTALRQTCSWFLPQLVKIFKIQFYNDRILGSLKRIFKEVLSSRQSAQNLRGNDLIDLLIEINRKQDGKYFTEEAMMGHAIQFFGAGFETVSTTLSFALYELTVHPEMQDRLREEILEFTEKDGDITYEAIQDMKYLDMVICEILRKYPVVPFLDRMCNADYKVPDSDLVIEKGTAVYIPIFGLHFDPKYFPEPEKFDPERFVNKSTINNNEMYYIPFGEGPRICIGERFGLVGVKLGLVSILSNYKLEKSSKTPIPIEFETRAFFPKSKVGIPVTFVPLK